MTLMYGIYNNFIKNIPKIFIIEINNICNLRCPECALGKGQITREKGNLSFEKFKIIADKIKPYSKTTYLMIWGEPFLNKDLIKIIKYASYFSETIISTNGMFLIEGTAIQLINSGLRTIIFSIDGTTQDTYQKYRIGGNLSTVMESLTMLNEMNKEYGNKIKIIPQFIVFEHNQHQIEEFKRICHFLRLKPSFKAPYISKDSSLRVSSFPKYSRKTTGTCAELQNTMKKCPDVRTACTVLLDGAVVPCCYDYNGINSFGNMYDQSVPEIWNNKRFVDFRKGVLSGNANYFCLNNCRMYYK